MLCHRRQASTVQLLRHTMQLLSLSTHIIPSHVLVAMAEVNLRRKSLRYWQRHVLEGRQLNSAIGLLVVAEPCHQLVWQSRQQSVSYGIEAAAR